MVDAVSVVCPEVKSKVEAISLSRRTIVRRIDAIAVNIHEQLLTASGRFQWFSIALDESTDIQDTAQLLIYIRGIDENFEITEELLSMESLKDTTTGKAVFFNWNGLPLGHKNLLKYQKFHEEFVRELNEA
ncbi:general transcription factor II-I repeat domain-containing protein 2-like [Octopus sinensis]|uniref:General transcription factor II-I repeat domain-containing protein 2-like n=1 Tax=Octopus sinensis TaxID=2607531 RepID=A0A6P7SG24_9MOLL|nr:general transcription factor II-I repeat domain-containing protein 2-like [Octopus sinensis]